MLTAEEQAWAHVWREAHDIAAEEMPRIKSGTCQLPGLAALLANFATKVAKAERERCAKIVHNNQIAFQSDACGWALDKIRDGLPADAIR